MIEFIKRNSVDYIEAFAVSACVTKTVRNGFSYWITFIL